MKSRLDTAASIAILMVAVLFVSFLGRQEYERHHHLAAANQTPLVGRTVSLPGVNFNPQGQPSNHQDADLGDLYHLPLLQG